MPLNSWRQWLNRTFGRTRTAPICRSIPLRIERLEDRCLLSISATGQAASFIEGMSKQVVVATFTDTTPSPAAGYTANIDWGDGTTDTGTVSLAGGTYSVTGSHTYAEEGSDTATVTIQETAGDMDAASANSSATVAEGDNLGAASFPSFTATEGALFSGTVGVFNDAGYPTNSPSDFTASIDWGDGATTAGTVSSAGDGNFTVSGAHTYADEGSPTVHVGLVDDAPGFANLTLGNAVTVAEADTLAAVSVQPNATLTEGASTSGDIAVFSDAGYPTNSPSDFTASIDWGDGTVTAGTVSSAGDGNFTVSGSHAYADEGSFTAAVVLSDDAPGTDSATASNAIAVAEADVLTVNPIQPSPTAAEGQSFSGRVANFINTNAANTTPADFTATIDWGDGTTTAGTVSNPAGNIYGVDGTHTYADEGNFTAAVVLSDDAPGTASATASNAIAVAEGDVLSGALAAVSPTEGTAFSGTVATFNDADTQNLGPDFTTTIQWGDGTTTAGTVTGGAGSFTVSGLHTYADEGTFTVTVVLSDDAPGTAAGTASGAVSVADADVLNGSAAPISTTEGTAVSGTVATFTDSYTGNTAADFTAAINWGDGTTTAGTVTGGAGSFTVSDGHTYTASGSFPVAVTLADDAPGAASHTATATASVSGDVVVDGTNGNDTLTLTETAGGGVGSITYTLNGGAPVTLTGVQTFTFNGLGGDDTMIVDCVNGKPLVPGGVFYDGGTGSNRLTLDANGLAVRAVPGALTIADPVTVQYTNVQATNINSAAAVNAFAGPDTADRATAFTGLTAQERFVQALYLDELGRAGTTAELDGWVGLMNAGGTQASVAADIQHSAEATDHLVRSWYVAYLGRQAVGGEELGFAALLQQGQSEEQVLSDVLASPEFYARAQTLIGSGTADERYVQALYLVLLNRTGEPTGVAGGLSILPSIGRQGLALAFLQSTEFRTDDFEAYYNALLHRPGDPVALSNWVFSNLDVASVRVDFEAGPEFFANG